VVSRAGFGLEGFEVGQAGVAPKVAGGVDDGLDPHRPAVFEVLLDPRMLVEQVEHDAADLLALLSDMEQAGRWRALNVGDYHDPFVERLGRLGVESVYGFKAKPGRGGSVKVGPGFYSGRGWAGTAIDAWLSSFLACPQGANKVSKLARAINVAECHLVIVLDPCSQAGMCISLALADHQEEGSAHDTIPSLVPPEPLTHVWLMPMMGPGTALWWARQRGWAVTNPMASTPR
jgi:hypothetical protein